MPIWMAANYVLVFLCPEAGVEAGVKVLMGAKLCLSHHYFHPCLYPASGQTLGPLSQDSLFTGRCGLNMFSPVPGGYQFLASSNSQVLLAHSHGGVQQSCCFCECKALQLVHAGRLLCVHERVEELLFWVPMHVRKLVPSRKHNGSCIPSTNSWGCNCSFRSHSMSSGDHSTHFTQMKACKCATRGGLAALLEEVLADHSL